MITALALAAVLGSPVQDKIDFELGWKLDDKFTYTVGFAGGGITTEGRMTITITKADEKGFTVSWPQIVLSGGISPVAAGTALMNRKGPLTAKGAVPDATSYLYQMILPAKPMAVGDEFKLSVEAEGARVDWNGKFEKLDETDGRIAHLVYQGTMHNADGSTLEVKQTSVFDLARGLFISSELEIVGFGTKFFLKLVEGDSGS